MTLSLSPLIRLGTSTRTHEGWQGQVYTRQYAKGTFARERLGGILPVPGGPLFRTPDTFEVKRKEGACARDRGACSARAGWFLLFIYSIWFVWLNETDRMNPSRQSRSAILLRGRSRAQSQKGLSLQNRCAGLLESAGLLEGAVVKTRLV
jgi:hypothetical protein